MLEKLFIVFLLVSSSISVQIEDHPSKMDPFKALGIPPFRMESGKHERENIPALNTLQDLPNFIREGAYKSNEGMKRLKLFFAKDDDEISEHGGIFDITGCDGLPEESPLTGPKESMARLDQRARSASLLWARKELPEAEIFGSTAITCKNAAWRKYSVILWISKSSKHKILKVCLPLAENRIAVLVSPHEEDCETSIPEADEFEERNNSILQEMKVRISLVIQPMSLILTICSPLWL